MFILVTFVILFWLNIRSNEIIKKIVIFLNEDLSTKMSYKLSFFPNCMRLIFLKRLTFKIQ